jgi:hypothetical protein
LLAANRKNLAMVAFSTLLAIRTLHIQPLSACLLSLGAAMLPAIGLAAPQPATFGFDHAPGIQRCGGVASVAGSASWSDPIYTAWDYSTTNSKAHLVLKLKNQIERYPAMRQVGEGTITYTANPPGSSVSLSFPSSSDGHQSVGGRGSLQLLSPGDSSPLSISVRAMEGC